MRYKTFYFPMTIEENVLDSFDHVNNAQYLIMFEEARWALTNQHGYNIEKIKTTGLGPTILEIVIRYMKELKVRDNIIIETQLLSYEGKIGKLAQRIVRINQNKDSELCCSAQFTMGLFDLQRRKLVLPTMEWLQAIGMQNNCPSISKSN